MKKERNRIKRTKLLMLFNMFLLLSMLAIPTYAYWEGVFDKKVVEDNTVEIGEGGTKQIVVALSDQTDEELVPVGFAEGTQVEQVVIEYTVNAKGAAGQYLVIDIEDIEIDGYDATHLFNFTITLEVADGLGILTGGWDGVNWSLATSGTADVENILVTVEITMNEPEDLSEYNLVAGKDLTFTLTFEIE